MTDAASLGPLAGLAGVWEGDQGLDVAFSHSKGEVLETPYRERASFGAFGPVDNGPQQLFGLDYRMSAWRADETDPFHTEVGYWLWDAGSGEVMRCFVVPRGSMVLAGAHAAATDRAFTLRAECGSETYGILSNGYLAIAARVSAYECAVTADGETYTYDQTTTVEHQRHGTTLAHTDRNTLRRVE